MLSVADLAQAANPAGLVTHLSGVLTARRADGSSKLLAVQSEVQQGDTLVTERDTYGRVKFSDGGEVVLRPGSQLVVASYVYDAAKPESDSVVLNLLKGGLRAVTGLVGKRNHDAVSVTTPTATIGIRGTHFGALFCQDDCDNVPTASGTAPANGVHVDVSEGAISLKNAVGEKVINAGQFGYARDPGTAPVIVPAQQGIQVTMPSSISQNKSSGRSIGASNANECTAR